MKAWPEKTLSPQRGILHRDLKPSNVLIDQFDRPRVTDFGLAKRLNVGQASGLPPAAFQYATNVRSTVGEMLAKAGETPGLLSSDLTATGQVLGTPNYMVLLLAVAIGSPIGLTAKGHAILNGDQRMLVWDFQNNASHEVPMKNTVANRQVYAVSRSGKLSAWTSWLDLVQLWDNSAWKEIARLRNSVPVFGNGLCFLPDERTLAITCRDGEIVIWNWTSGSSKTFKTGLDEPLVITISADGKLLACEEAQSRIRVWSLPGGEEVAVLKGHRQYIHDLAFAPDGKTLASCSNDGTVRLWNVQLAQETAILRIVPAGTKGTNIRVWSLAFSPDGNTLAAYAGNGTLKVCRAASWEEILKEERQAQTAGSAKRHAVSQPR